MKKDGLKSICIFQNNDLKRVCTSFENTEDLKFPFSFRCDDYNFNKCIKMQINLTEIRRDFFYLMSSSTVLVLNFMK